MKIYLVRHTSVGLPKGICYGQTDVPLSQSFEEEAEIVKEKIKDIPFDAVFSSPLSRCLNLAKYCGFEDRVQLFDRLKELHFGDWEMTEWDKLRMTEWETDWINNPTPNGESFKGMIDRVSSFFDELKEQPHDTVIVFTHGGVINCAKVYFGMTDIEKAFDNLATYGEIIQFELNK